MDEYFFTEIKPFLFSSGGVRNRTLRFAKQSVAENYKSLCVRLDKSRDGSICDRGYYPDFIPRILAQTRTMFDASSIFRLLDRANRVFP